LWVAVYECAKAAREGLANCSNQKRLGKNQKFSTVGLATEILYREHFLRTAGALALWYRGFESVSLDSPGLGESPQSRSKLAVSGSVADADTNLSDRQPVAVEAI
jgi:hypothetical protein